MKEERIATGEAVVRERIRGLVREQPWLAVAAAAAAGGLLGGLWLSKASRLAFAAATGFVAQELWNREGKTAVSDIVTRWSGHRSGPGARR